MRKTLFITAITVSLFLVGAGCAKKTSNTPTVSNQSTANIANVGSATGTFETTPTTNTSY